MDKEGLKQIALLMANSCVRNTVLEDYHARGSLSQDDMKALNKQVANRVYTFLRILMQDDDHQWVKFEAALRFTGQFPTTWDSPEDDANFMMLLRLVDKVKVRG